MMKRIAVLTTLLFVLLFGAIQVYACWVESTAFETESADGLYVFSFNPEGEDLGTAQAEVYKNDEGRELVYTVNGLSSFAFKDCFYFSRDFRHFAFFPPDKTRMALMFYSDGEPVSEYTCEDLKHFPFAPGMPLASTGPDPFQTIEHLSEEDLLVITTAEGHTFTFDITTGQISAIGEV